MEIALQGDQLVSVPSVGVTLSGPLGVVALVGRYPTN